MSSITHTLQSPRNHIVSGLFLVSLGTYLVTPLYAIHLVNSLGLRAADVGLLLIISSVAQRGLTLPIGIAIDKTDVRVFLFLGLGLRALSFFILGIADSFTLLAIAAAAGGSGAAAFQTAGKSILVEIDADKALSFALRNMAINAGIALGPLVGIFFTSYSFSTICWTTCGVYGLVAVVEMFVLKRLKLRAPVSENGGYLQLFAPLRLPKIRFLLVSNFCFFLFFSLFELIFPLYLVELQSATSVAFMFALNAVLVVFLQLPVARLIANYHLEVAHGFSVLLLSLVFFLLSCISSSPWSLLWFFTGICVFSLAEVYLMFIVDFHLANFVGSKSTGTVFGCSSLSAMLGLSSGLLFFGWLYDRRESLAIADFWLIVLALCLLVVLPVYYLEHRSSRLQRP
ncbi:MFS transporter [Pseudomonas sp. NPDC087598]|uniref:MFS transporter n=1 Tax=Pseudomonas sp. NPDC087598 TaxID=3364440 RepID=UPI0037F7AC52